MALNKLRETLRAELYMAGERTDTKVACRASVMVSTKIMLLKEQTGEESLP